MRLHGLALIGFVSFAGCSITADAIPDAKGHAKAFVLHVDRDARGSDLVAQHLGLAPIFAATAPTRPSTATHATSERRVEIAPATATIDVAAIATNALGLPAVIERLRRDLAIAIFVLLAFGAIGAFVAMRSRASGALAGSMLARTPAYDDVAIREDDAIASTRRCTCDAEISPRSRTGRCRSCARKARVRAPRVVLDMPAILAAASAPPREEDESGAGVAPERVVLTESRVGQHRAYYTSESFS